jgi:hypothetical protein
MDFSDEVEFIELFEWALSSREYSDKLEELETLFDVVILEFTETYSKYLKHLGELIVSNFDDESFKYQQKGLMGMHIESDLQEEMEISNELAEAFAILREQLNQCNNLLGKDAFHILWKQVASDLSKLFYSKVIQRNAISSFGALQFVYDMKTLFALFRPFTAAPASFFKELKEILLILTLDEDLFLRFHSSINQEAPAETTQKILKNYGIIHLSLTEIRSIVNGYYKRKLEENRKLI